MNAKTEFEKLNLKRRIFFKSKFITRIKAKSYVLFQKVRGQALQVETFVSYSAQILRVKNGFKLVSLYENQNYICLYTLTLQSGLQALEGRLCKWRP